MLSLVDGEGSILTETFATDVALEGLVFAVDVFVVSKMVLSSEGLAADVTREWALVGVGAFVD